MKSARNCFEFLFIIQLFLLMSWSFVAWQLDDVHSPNSVPRASINLHLAHRMQKKSASFSWKQTSPTSSATGTLFRIYGSTKILLLYSIWSKISFLCVCKRAFIGSNLLSFSRSPGLWILTKLYLLTFLCNGLPPLCSSFTVTGSLRTFTWFPFKPTRNSSA